MKPKFFLAILLVSSTLSFMALGQDRIDGEGVNSQNLWVAPGPSNFPFTQSAEVLPHRALSLGVVADYYRKPLGLQYEGDVSWTVKRVTAMDFSWAVGLMDRFQLGIVLPVIVEQFGAGASVLQQHSDEAGKDEISSAAVGDMRIHGKTIFFQQYPSSDIRGAGIALDIGLSVPTGDEGNFAGENGIVFAPSCVIDFQQRWLSAAANGGVRLRSGEKSGLADSSVGNQLSYGLALTIHLFEDKLLLSGETNMLVELDNMDRIGLEMRGALGTKPGKTRAVTLWLTGSAGLANSDQPLLSVPESRFTLGIRYTPSADDAASDLLF